MEENEKRLLTTKEVAWRFRVHPNYVYGLAARGELRTVRMGGRTMFLEEDVDRYIEERRSAPVRTRLTLATLDRGLRDAVKLLREGRAVEPGTPAAEKLSLTYEALSAVEREEEPCAS